MYSDYLKRKHREKKKQCFLKSVDLRYINTIKLGETAHMVKIKGWTDEEVKRLKELYTSNKTLDEIADKFPLRTENAIRLKASRLGIKRPYIGNIIQVKPITFKSVWLNDSIDYLLKCKECGYWMQVDKSSQHESNILSCGKCGNLYQVIADL